jgi:Adenylate and Guanylate cyclase catalytic domain
MCDQVNDPAKVMMYLNDLFGLFDVGVGLNGGYKLETVGDAYIVAVGLMQNVRLVVMSRWRSQLIVCQVLVRPSAYGSGVLLWRLCHIAEQPGPKHAYRTMSSARRVTTSSLVQTQVSAEDAITQAVERWSHSLSASHAGSLADEFNLAPKMSFTQAVLESELGLSSGSGRLPSGVPAELARFQKAELCAKAVRIAYDMSLAALTVRPACTRTRTRTRTRARPTTRRRLLRHAGGCCRQRVRACRAGAEPARRADAAAARRACGPRVVGPHRRLQPALQRLWRHNEHRCAHGVDRRARPRARLAGRREAAAGRAVGVEVRAPRSPAWSQEARMPR